jgi:serine/threonine protein kinase
MSDAQNNKDQKVKEFYDRLALRLSELKAASAPSDALTKFITKADLIEIYRNVFRNQQLKKYLRHDLMLPIYWSKEDSHLARTVNIVFDPLTNDICLMLETKSKVLDASNATKKDSQNTPKFSGTSKTTKPAWRIDTSKPIKYANAVFYAQKKVDLEGATTEAELPKKIVSVQQKDIFLTLSATGGIIDEPGTRSSNQKPYKSKKSFYSKWANKGNLDVFLKSNEAKALTSNQLDELSKHLLMAVDAMHRKNFIHQDIKPDNILVFLDENGHYRFELSDFGLAYDPSKPKENYIPLATLGYESPEISAIHYYYSTQPNFNHAYFHDSNYTSYGRELFLSKKRDYRSKIEVYPEKFSTPSKENDMWAIGVVLHQLYNKGLLPTVANSGSFSPLVKSLLNTDRKKRFTAEQALACLQPEVSPTFPELSEPSTTIPVPKSPLQPAATSQATKPSHAPNHPLLPRVSALTDRLPPRAPKAILPQASKLADRLPKVPTKAAPGPSSRVPKALKNKENDQQSPEKDNKPPWR